MMEMSMRCYNPVGNSPLTSLGLIRRRLIHWSERAGKSIGAAVG
jgi:hypothetical protein